MSGTLHAAAGHWHTMYMLVGRDARETNQAVRWFARVCILSGGARGSTTCHDDNACMLA